MYIHYTHTHTYTPHIHTHISTHYPKKLILGSFWRENTEEIFTHRIFFMGEKKTDFRALHKNFHAARQGCIFDLDAVYVGANSVCGAICTARHQTDDRRCSLAGDLCCGSVNYLPGASVYIGLCVCGECIYRRLSSC